MQQKKSSKLFIYIMTWKAEIKKRRWEKEFEREKFDYLLNWIGNSK